MKLLTLNTHSLIEENYYEKLKTFVSVVADELPDIIALQEVNQTIDEAEIAVPGDSYVPCCDDISIRKDNHAYNVFKMLNDMGIKYYWTWLPMKIGYSKYDEGIAIMSRSRILETDAVKISEVDDYNNWKTRKIVGIRTESNPDEWYFSVHYGWWGDADEPFEMQWQRTDSHMKKFGRVWIMGDFNSPAEVRGEGYDMIKDSDWFDSYVSARKKDNGITVGKIIDGWKDKIIDTDGIRIDQIWCNKKTDINTSSVIFNGVNKPVVSDHYGIVIEYERNEE